MKKYCLISHTHWDREWYLPFEQFRIKLVSLLDNLQLLFEDYPDYIFHLDAQTVALEDYLEIRSDRRGILEHHIREGRLLVGPWYVQSDFFLTSGEATIRNLSIGSSQAGSFGADSFIGYAPDQFGIISQLPQILRGFNINSMVFGRGFKRDRPVSEFRWKGSDGSVLLSFNLCHWYNNAQRFSRDTDKNLALMEKLEVDMSLSSVIPLRLCMNGVDHLEAQEDLLQRLKELNETNRLEGPVQQYSLYDYIEEAGTYIADHGVPLTEHRGELREGTETDILNGTLSSRIYLKRENLEAEILLETVLEPFYSMLYLAGGKSSYPGDYLSYLWKTLLKNHAHDSICGCSADAVHDQMEDRYKSIRECSGFLLEQGMESFISHIDRKGFSDGGSLLVFINTLQRKRSSVEAVTLQFPANEGVEAFNILDAQARPVSFIVLNKELVFRNILSPINLPGNLLVDSFDCLVWAEAPAFGYSTYEVIPGITPSGSAMPPESGRVCVDTASVQIENEYVSIIVHSSGRIDFVDKDNGFSAEDIITFEESADCGDVYTYKGNGQVCSLTSVPEIEFLQNNALRQELILRYKWELPSFFDRGSGERSEETVNNILELSLRIDKGNTVVRIGVRLDNQSRDHRLRMVIKTGIESDRTFASTPFDIIERPFGPVQGHEGDVPTSGWVAVPGGSHSMAVLTKGIYGYEHLDSRQGKVAMTLVRGNKYIFKDFDRVNTRNSLWEAEGNQCLREIVLDLGICFLKDSDDIQDLFWALNNFRQEMITIFQPVDDHKFKGGRPAVQDPAIREIHFEKDRYPAMKLARGCSYLSVMSKGVFVSAFKLADNGDYHVLRLYNPGSDCRPVELLFAMNVINLYILNLNEEILEDVKEVEVYLETLAVKPKKIVTLGIVLDE